MSDRKTSQRYLSGRSKVIGFSGLSSDRHLYIAPGEVEPNLGYPGEKPIPISNDYYQLITIPNGTTYDRYWQIQPGLLPGGISIFDEGFLVGTANSVTKLNFVGSGVSATVSGSISTITIDRNARVAVSTEPPTPAYQGDLWWDNDVGELYVYYEDGNSNQWVETSGGSETVTISDTAPPSSNSGDLWWDSSEGVLYIYYDDGNSEQWVDANSSATENWQVNGYLSIDNTVSYGTTTFITSSIAQVGIHSVFSIDTYRSVDYTIQATEGTNFHTTKLLAIHDGLIGYHTEYTSIFNNVGVSTYDVDISDGKIRLLATPSSSSNTIFKISFSGIKT